MFFSVFLWFKNISTFKKKRSHAYPVIISNRKGSAFVKLNVTTNFVNFKNSSTVVEVCFFFQRVAMEADLHFQRYGLYAYSEGHFTAAARAMHFTGVPVLFVPGNGGSHKQGNKAAKILCTLFCDQSKKPLIKKVASNEKGRLCFFSSVRSFASIALRKALNSRQGFHFDFFAVELNNELSGLNGALLNEQMLYVNHSVNRILQLYDDRRRLQPESVIIIGHSMV